jgi:hypothetical protein
MRSAHRLIRKLMTIESAGAFVTIVSVGFLTTFFAAGAVTLTPSAMAAAPPPMIVQVHPASGEVRSYFDFPAKPGKSAAAGTLELRNRLHRKVTVLVDPIDGLTASTLGSAYSVRGRPVHSSARWTRLSDRRIELGPRGRAEVDVNVLPPAGAEPGDYLSGIGVQAAGAGKSKSNGSLAISSVERYAVGVLVRLPGPRHPLIRFTGARVEQEAAGVTFYLSARNRGNVILQDVKGSQLITRGEQVVAKGPMGPGTFVTGTSIDYPVLVPREQAREGSEYRVRAVLRYRGGIARLDTLVRFGHRSAVRQQQLDGEKKSSSNNILGLLLAAGAGAALLGFLVFLLWRRRSRRRSPLRTLEQALASARANGEPLSLIRVGGEKAPARDLEGALGSRLRRSDRVCRLNGSGILIVAPDTPVQTAEQIAQELRRQLDRGRVGSDGVDISVFVPSGTVTAAELLEQVTR